MSIIYTKTVPELPLNKKEILRYCGVRETSEQVDKLVDECLTEIEGKIINRICYGEYDALKCDGCLDLGFTKTDSQLILKHLKGCKRVVLFAATVGIGIDRLISKYSVISPSKAVIFQAIGAERIEALCDCFESEIKEKYGNSTSRISPGYGDIPIGMQRDIFSTLNCPKNIGLSLNKSLLMSPSKSVTAIIGI